MKTSRMFFILSFFRRINSQIFALIENDTKKQELTVSNYIKIFQQNKGNCSVTDFLLKHSSKSEMLLNKKAIPNQIINKLNFSKLVNFSE